ncbi:NUDIX hydrolase [Streptomyces sp. NPDC001552]|uniref:NUDIX hydrolase n=1 Tax=Streptomyces sp. NPDC001552 TaxID=3364587 RepID=UPI0036B8C92E
MRCGRTRPGPGGGSGCIVPHGVPRPSVRVVRVAPDQRILLLRWRDPATGNHTWEPPGGGIEADEDPLAAARRELNEEVGLRDAPIGERSIVVARKPSWNGVDFAGEEAFFLCLLPLAPEVRPGGLEQYEVEQLQEHRWVPWHELGDLPDPVEPLQLLDVLTAPAPDDPNRRRTRARCRPRTRPPNPDRSHRSANGAASCPHFSPRRRAPAG